MAQVVDEGINTVEQVVLVDANDQVIGVSEKIRAHELALLHRAFSIFVYRKVNNASHDIEFLLQQRHREKYHCAGLWSNTCCGHPRLTETVILAAQRRLREEMSIDATLQEVGVFQYKAICDNGLTEHELDHVLIGEYNVAQPVVLHPQEAQDFSWVEARELVKSLSLDPKLYTPWLKPALDIALEGLCFTY